MLQVVNFKGVKVPKNPECRVPNDDSMPMGIPHGHKPQPVSIESSEVMLKQRSGTANFQYGEARTGSHPMLTPLGFCACILYTGCWLPSARLQTHMLSIATQGQILYRSMTATALARYLPFAVLVTIKGGVTDLARYVQQQGMTHEDGPASSSS